jgi:hypothetical protein
LAECSRASDEMKGENKLIQKHIKIIIVKE